ncbi:hypothetical protein GIB67_006373 [Kingdonia uniflora]|uniref:Mur ligase central domain-containing protein n=1 Tax=Kingdonia uniflora TaxID=39325 RepID=A0A7J7P0M8_9MAGN|nr:hypothetical protein GIB67_006373 [Kingdonia uniflora]
MKLFALLGRCGIVARRETSMISSPIVAIRKTNLTRNLSTRYNNEDPELKEFLDYLDNLKNYEKSGVPKGAGTDSSDGFDMGRMKRLMERLGNPQCNYKAVHIAGTKGKGSTAAFVANILREEGYSVGCYTSPHLWSIRERISLGKNGDLVSAKALISLFHQVKDILDRTIELEDGSISHFEVLTAVAFTLFARESIDIAVVEAGLGGARDATNVFSSSELAESIITTIGEEHLDALGGSLENIARAKSGIIKYGRPVVLGGPFKPHIERILWDKASLLDSLIVSASDSGSRSTIKNVEINNGKPCQVCDILIQVEKDLQLFIELNDVKLCMLGTHQLQNAVTATCASLCLRDQGWKVSDKSIRAGLERTNLYGRSQFLTSEEAGVIGLAGTTILVDGAHTEESAKALAELIQMTHPDAPLAFVVAMANDKDHLAFAKQLLSGRLPAAVFLTKVNIAGAKSRMTSASILKDAWVKAASELGVGFLDVGIETNEKKLDDQSGFSAREFESRSVIVIGGSVEDSMKSADLILKAKTEGQSGIIVVTGSLHIVSLLLGSLEMQL